MAEQTNSTLVGAQGPCMEAADVSVLGERDEYAVVFGDLTAHRHGWELKQLQIGLMAREEEAALLLFTAVAELPFALEVTGAWGFVYQSVAHLKGRLAGSHVSPTQSPPTPRAPARSPGRRGPACPRGRRGRTGYTC